MRTFFGYADVVGSRACRPLDLSNDGNVTVTASVMVTLHPTSRTIDGGSTSIAYVDRIPSFSLLHSGQLLWYVVSMESEFGSSNSRISALYKRGFFLHKFSQVPEFKLCISCLIISQTSASSLTVGPSAIGFTCK